MILHVLHRIEKLDYGFDKYILFQYEIFTSHVFEGGRNQYSLLSLAEYRVFQLIYLKPFKIAET